MRKSRTTVKTMIAVALAIPAPAIWAQYTGTSHPDEVPVTTSADGVRQPVVYVPAASPTAQPAMAFASPAPAPAPAAKPETHFDPATQLVRSAQVPDSDAGVVVRVPGPSNALPAGTLVKTKLLQGLSTKSTVEGSEWRAELLEALMRDGQVLVPAGTILRGKVTQVHGGKRISGEAAIHLQTLSVLMPDGTSLGMHAQVIDTDLYHTTKVDREGTILRRDHKKEDGGILALTAGSGAAAGALMGGVPGALVGAGVGAGVSTAIWLKQDRQAELPKDTQVTFELTKTMMIGLEQAR